MRFLLATTILAQSLSTASSLRQPLDTKTNTELILNRQQFENFSELGQPVGASRSASHQNESEQRQRTRRRLQYALQRKNAIIHAKPSVLRNQQTDSFETPPEHRKECEPDIGILGCGISEYCVESDLSALGGLCVSKESLHELHRRSLQSDFYPPPSVCDPSSFEAENYDCDCEAFDLAQEVGEFTCTLNEYTCKRDNLCGKNDVTHIISEDGAFASYCYAFEKPYDIDLCYTMDTERNCNISIQNEACNKCEIVDGVTHPVYGFIGYNCYEFDCTNTIARLKGNNCAGNYVLDALNGITMPSSAPSTPLPSALPSESPSQVPSWQPSIAPTVTASSQPTPLPSFSPSTLPSSAPTDSPSQHPSTLPSTIPSSTPSSDPSMTPTVTHSSTPTMVPSFQPSMQPSLAASSVPTRVASDHPSLNPSGSPSIATAHPSEAPSFEPWNADKANRSHGQETDSAGYPTRGQRSLPLCICWAIIIFALW